MSTTGKNTLSIRKKDVASQKDLALGFKKLVFAHKAAAGETTVDLTALVTPTEMSTLGFTNPSAADLAAAQIKLYQDNLILTSSARPFLIKDLSYKVGSNTNIQLQFSTLEDEIIVGYIDHVPKTGLTVVDARPIVATGTLAANTTDINVGQPFEAGKYPSAQAGAVLVYIDGVLQARNSGNASSPQDGNYYEVSAGGLSTLVRMNQSSTEDRSYIVISNGLIAEKPEGSQLAEIEKAQGQIDAMIPTLAALAGVPETDFQAAPNNQDLKQFGDRVLDAENRITVLEEATTEIIASYWASANRATSPSQPIDFDSQEVDTDGLVTTGSAWKFTAPEDGLYEIRGSGGSTVGQYAILYKNGLAYKSMGATAVGANQAGIYTTIVYLNQSEYIDVRSGAANTVFGGTLANLGTSNITIRKVGNI